MGGFGSGRPYEGRPRVGAAKQIKIGAMAKMGALTEGWSASLKWSGSGCDDMEGTFADDTLRLSWNVEADRESLHVVMPISVSWSDCNYGGRRPWMICPYCARRVSTLHLSSNSKQLACRHCFNMTYESRNVDAIGRSWMREEKLLKRVGGTCGGGLSSRGPSRPKGMHRTTYHRICKAAFDEEWRRDEALNDICMARFGCRWG
ncbi:hypothetical protein [Acetobacter cibinongensis]|uniref:hypothetical protein n=1 Tax=Acetobacter cibinongensis TaxID=146475 RepID=UPI000AF12A9B|nr:hypothetical protein [Acetobacter cibinongensis]